MFVMLVIVLAVVVLTVAGAGLVAFGSRVGALPYDPGYDTRRPIL